MTSEENDAAASKETSETGNPAASKAAPTAGSGRPPATIRYIDRPDIMETFADAVSGLVFDGQTLRIEFAVTRFDEVKPNAPVTARRYPACRLALSPAAAVELINRMQQVGTALRQAAATRAAGRPTDAAAT